MSNKTIFVKTTDGYYGMINQNFKTLKILNTWEYSNPAYAQNFYCSTSELKKNGYIITYPSSYCIIS